MIKKFNRNEARLRRHARLRKKVSGSSDVPRLCVYRSNKAIYTQVIDDTAGKTLVSCSTKELGLTGNNVENSAKVGQKVAEKALDAGIKQVVFDRGGYNYHGKVKAIADAAREAGLKL